MHNTDLKSMLSTFTPYNPNATRLGQGSYNTAYRLNDLVIKDPRRPHEDLISNAMRAVRIYKQINPQDAASVAADQKNDRWCLPFVNSTNETLTDEKLAAAVLDIHEKTGRIVFDAAVPGNFIPTMVDNTVKYKLVDVDQAMLLPRKKLNRRGSEASEAYFDNDYFSQEKLLQWVNKYSVTYPKTMATIVYLLISVDNLNAATKTLLLNKLSYRPAMLHFCSLQATQSDYEEKSQLDSFQATQSDYEEKSQLDSFQATRSNVSCNSNNSLTNSNHSILKAVMWSILWVSLGVVLAFSGVELFAIFASSLIAQVLTVAAAVFIGAIGSYFFLKPESTINSRYITMPADSTNLDSVRLLAATSFKDDWEVGPAYHAMPYSSQI